MKLRDNLFISSLLLKSNNLWSIWINSSCCVLNFLFSSFRSLSLSSVFTFLFSKSEVLKWIVLRLNIKWFLRYWFLLIKFLIIRYDSGLFNRFLIIIKSLDNLYQEGNPSKFVIVVLSFLPGWTPWIFFILFLRHEWSILQLCYTILFISQIRWPKY